MDRTVTQKTIIYLCLYVMPIIYFVCLSLLFFNKEIDFIKMLFFGYNDFHPNILNRKLEKYKK